MRYEWPGNVRELENTIERAVVLARGDVIDAEDLPGEVRTGVGRRPATARASPFAIGTPLAEIERRVIHATLAHVGGDKRLCAQLLGIATRTIYRRLEEERDGERARRAPDIRPARPRPIRTPRAPKRASRDRTQRGTRVAGADAGSANAPRPPGLPFWQADRRMQRR